MSQTTPKILILDAMWNKTLAVVRALGKRGFHLVVGEKTRFAAALFSRYCNRRVVYPSPLSSPDKFLDWLLREIKTNHYDIILPTELETQQLILKNRKEFEKYTRVPFADYGLISHVQNKAWLMKFAEANGYPCPRTYFVKDVIFFNYDSLEYPVVIKPRESSGSRGLAYVDRPSDFLKTLQTVHKNYPFPLIQEYIPNGGAYGIGALFNYNSEPRAVFVYKRLREYPVTGGPSTLRESVKNDELKDIAIGLLRSLKWVGVAMVEFRVDPRDGKPKLMEINPRFWGSLQLAIMSGVDFPYLLYRMAMDGDVEPAWDYRVGVRCRWLIPGDLLHFLSNLKRLRKTTDFFTMTNGDDIISASDPMPAIGRVLSLLPLIYDKDMRKMLFR
ncbi:MAG: ATP-grasp domain-containing protein [Deltaproteobacteria bacterium]|nr:ATP-grasp domain-containing protein [Deltaproteobacteria bacterium]